MLGVTLPNVRVGVGVVGRVGLVGVVGGGGSAKNRRVFAKNSVSFEEKAAL